MSFWISSGEGLGRYDRERFSYNNPPVVTANRPTALAMEKWSQPLFDLISNTAMKRGSLATNW